MEELKEDIKNMIEDRIYCEGIITDVVCIPITQAGKRQIMIGLDTLTHNQSSHYYDLEDYPTDEDLINAIILNNLEELSYALIDYGWEKAKKRYCSW